MLTSGKLASEESVSYSLRLWMDESTPMLDEVMDATFQAKITVTATYVPKAKGVELYNIIKNSAVLDNVASEFVTSSTGINFGEAPSDTNGKGVYTIADTADDEYPVHYFRGNVTNNNVKLAGFCWKIVRTTETGGVKLIYNGTPNSEGGCTNTTGGITQIGTSKFNENNNSADYVGYMYPESTNENSSTIKTTIDAWYQNNMTDYTSYLEDTVWCNDQSVYKTEGSGIYYGANGRNWNTYSPSIECPNENDKFTVSSEVGNGKLTYPVALLTADEATLAGHGTSGYSNTSYLYTNYWYLLLSPYYFGNYYAYGFGVYSSGYLFNRSVDISGGVRPSLSLAPGTLISENSDGSMDNPYLVLNNK